jgi:DNA-binding Lrp family transcriptional regulator
MSDKMFAEMLGVSDKTVSRALKNLEDKDLIKRETKNVKGGKERHIRINNGQNVPCKQPTTDKLSFAQQTNCPLHNGQNDLIKEKGKEKGKDNNEILLADANKISTVSPEGKVKRSQLESMRCQYEELGNNLVKITQTGKIFELEGETK